MKIKVYGFLALIVIVAAAWKICLMAINAFPFNSDEAVVALMARHILAGETPTFFYGQAYMGSLDAFLVAAGFALFGQAVWVIRLVQTLLYIGTIIATVFIGRVAFGSISTGQLAGLFMAIPVVNTTLYTTVSLGGYGEAMFFGSFSLLIGFHILNFVQHHSQPNNKLIVLLFGWGLVSGIGAWANSLSLVFSVPVALMLVILMVKQPAHKAGYWKRAWIGIIGLGVGSLPWWLYAIQNGFSKLLTELTGSAVAVEQGSWLVRIWDHFLNLIVLGFPAAFGLRPSWEVRWLALPLIPFILAFWGIVGLFFYRSLRQRQAETAAFVVLGGIILTFCLGFLLTSFGVDPSGRYFLPLAVPFSLIGAQYVLMVVKNVKWQIGLAALILAFNAWGTLESAFRNPPGITTQFDAITVIDQTRMPDLIAFLKQTGETSGYSNYWVSYPLAFLSGEELIYTPRLPYHSDLRYTPRDDRYAPYDLVVQSNPKEAFITTRNPALNDDLRKQFTQQGVTWFEKQIGDFQIFYNLSKKVEYVENPG
ncbi:MAG TPA: hypothetical protein VMS73_05335 [Anaerolineaceae bacterium]|nr:hypothetical protein [Anaerolineaceae bacterium]